MAVAAVLEVFLGHKKAVAQPSNLVVVVDVHPYFFFQMAFFPNETLHFQGLVLDPLGMVFPQHIHAEPLMADVLEGEVLFLGNVVEEQFGSSGGVGKVPFLHRNFLEAHFKVFRHVVHQKLVLLVDDVCSVQQVFPTAWRTSPHPLSASSRRR